MAIGVSLLVNNHAEYIGSKLVNWEALTLKQVV